MRYYLDYNASAPMQESVKNYIKEILDLYGNPSSIHFNGRKLKNILEIARQRIASLVNCSSKNIIFTSGATNVLSWAFAKKFAKISISKIMIFNILIPLNFILYKTY